MNQRPPSGWLRRLLPDSLRGERLFNLERSFRQTRRGLERPDGISSVEDASSGDNIWLLSRGCYTVRILDLANVPAAKREQAIRLAIAGWSPFTETAHYIIPNDRGAKLCAWDGAMVADVMAQAGVQRDAMRVIPESALRLEAALDKRENTASAQLLAALDGYTGSVTGGGSTLAEQWWPELPTASQWQNFLRGAGVDASAVLGDPAPRTESWRSQPVGYPADREVTSFSTNEAIGIWIVALALTIPTIWYANQLRLTYAAKFDTSERLRQTEKDLDSVLSSREAALGTQDRAKKLAELLDTVDHLQLFALINDIVMQNAAPNSLQLTDWEVRPTLLKFSLIATVGTPPAASTLVKALERVQTFRDVEARLDGSRINVTLRLIPASNIAPAPIVPVQSPTPNVIPAKRACATAPVFGLPFDKMCEAAIPPVALTRQQLVA